MEKLAEARPECADHAPADDPRGRDRFSEVAERYRRSLIREQV